MIRHIYYCSVCITCKWVILRAVGSATPPLPVIPMSLRVRWSRWSKKSSIMSIRPVRQPTWLPTIPSIVSFQISIPQVSSTTSRSSPIMWSAACFHPILISKAILENKTPFLLLKSWLLHWIPPLHPSLLSILVLQALLPTSRKRSPCPFLLLPIRILMGHPPTIITPQQTPSPYRIPSPWTAILLLVRMTTPVPSTSVPMIPNIPTSPLLVIVNTTLVALYNLPIMWILMLNHNVHPRTLLILWRRERWLLLFSLNPVITLLLMRKCRSNHLVDLKRDASSDPHQSIPIWIWWTLRSIRMIWMLIWRWTWSIPRPRIEQRRRGSNLIRWCPVLLYSHYGIVVILCSPLILLVLLSLTVPSPLSLPLISFFPRRSLFANSIMIFILRVRAVKVVRMKLFWILFISRLSPLHPLILYNVYLYVMVQSSLAICPSSLPDLPVFLFFSSYPVDVGGSHRGE